MALLDAVDALVARYVLPMSTMEKAHVADGDR